MTKRLLEDKENRVKNLKEEGFSFVRARQVSVYKGYGQASFYFCKEDKVVTMAVHTTSKSKYEKTVKAISEMIKNVYGLSEEKRLSIELDCIGSFFVTQYAPKKFVDIAGKNRLDTKISSISTFSR